MHGWLMALSLGLLLALHALGDYSTYAQEDIVDGVSSAYPWKISITGRKMLGQPVSKNEIKRKEESSFVISSEEGSEASNKYLEGSKIDQLNDQVIDFNDQEDETRRLLEDTEEVESLMQQDYRRYARRKPPINNHEPYH